MHVSHITSVWTCCRPWRGSRHCYERVMPISKCLQEEHSEHTRIRINMLLQYTTHDDDDDDEDDGETLAMCASARGCVCLCDVSNAHIAHNLTIAVYTISRMQREE